MHSGCAFGSFRVFTRYVNRLSHYPRTIEGMSPSSLAERRNTVLEILGNLGVQALGH